MTLIEKRAKYRLLFLTLVGYILISPFTQDDLLGRFLYACLFLFVMIGVSANIRPEGHKCWIIPLLGMIVLITTFLDSLSLGFMIASKLIALLYFTYAIFLFGKNIFTDYHRDFDRIFGSISVYLLIGVVYAIIYLTIQTIYPGSIVYQQTGKSVIDSFDFYYFSFITLTTVGFGDIIPTNDLTRAFAMLEGITGLFYLAVLVASLTNILKGHTSK